MIIIMYGGNNLHTILNWQNFMKSWNLKLNTIVVVVVVVVIRGQLGHMFVK
jgi:hypothetical protein